MKPTTPRNGGDWRKSMVKRWMVNQEVKETDGQSLMSQNVEPCGAYTQLILACGAIYPTLACMYFWT